MASRDPGAGSVRKVPAPGALGPGRAWQGQQCVPATPGLEGEGNSVISQDTHNSILGSVMDKRYSPKTTRWRNWRKSSIVKSMYCSWRGPSLVPSTLVRAVHNYQLQLRVGVIKCPLLDSLGTSINMYKYPHKIKNK